MTPRDFLYWFRGFIEIAEADGNKVKGLTTNQLDMVKRHMELAMTNVTAPVGEPPSVQPAVSPFPVPFPLSPSVPQQWHPDFTTDKIIC